MTTQALNRPVDVLAELVAVHQRAWNIEMERQRVAGEPTSHIKATRAALAALLVEHVLAPREPTAQILAAIADANDETDWVWTGEDEIGVSAPGQPDAIYHAIVDAIGSQP